MTVECTRSTANAVPRNRDQLVLSAWCIVAAFGTYSCMYAFRRPFTAAAFAFMVLLGLGLYLPYVAIHTTVFERLIAMTRDRANIGYLMYLADAFGYLGYVAVMLGRGFLSVDDDFLAFFLTACWIIAIGSALFLVRGWWYFSRLSQPAPALNAAPGPDYS